jgi:polysaccharide pyruvyl transferase CsaB
MSRILISGWYGNGNLGDEALLSGMVRSIRSADPSIDPVVLSDDAARTAREHRLPARSRSGSGHRRRLLSELRGLPRYRGLAIGGGGLIKDFGPHPGNVHAWLRPGIAARLAGKRTMWYAVGVDDVRHERSRAVARRAARLAHVISVREMGIRRELLVTADPAFLAAEPDPGWRSEDRPLVAVCPRRWKAGGPDVEQPDLERQVLSELAGALDMLVETRRAGIVLLPFHGAPGDDHEVCRDLAARMAHSSEARVLKPPRDAAAAAAVLSSCQLVVGTRLHSLILAAAAAVPFYGLDYMPKVRFFAEHAGARRWTADLEHAAASGHLTRELLAALDGGTRRRPALERVARAMRGLARLDGHLLATMLRRPDHLPAIASRASALEGELRRAAADRPAPATA